MTGLSDKPRTHRDYILVSHFHLQCYFKPLFKMHIICNQAFLQVTDTRTPIQLPVSTIAMTAIGNAPDLLSASQPLTYPDNYRVSSPQETLSLPAARSMLWGQGLLGLQDPAGRIP